MSDVSLTELYVIAMDIEEKGMEFYKKLLHNVKIEEGKNLIRNLIKEEEVHFAHFQKIIEEYADGKPVSNIIKVLDYDALIKKYLELFFPNRIFSPDYMKNIDWKDVQSLFSFALRMEKDSICFYEKLKEFDNKQKNHTILNEILAQEQKHLLKIQEVARQQM